MTVQILVFDNQPKVGALIQSVAEPNGHHVTVTADAREFRSAVAQGMPDVIFVDVTVDNTNGIELLKHIHVTGCSAQIAIMSQLGQEPLRQAQDYARAVGMRVIRALIKPFKGIEIVETLVSARNH